VTSPAGGSRARADDRVLAEAHVPTGDARFLSGLSAWLAEPLSGCTQGVIREAAIVLGELLTNAYQHADPPYRVWLTVRSRGHLVRLSVDDSGQPPPAPWPPGKGLFVVRGLCPDWGVDPTPTGKTVWGELPVLVGPTA